MCNRHLQFLPTWIKYDCFLNIFVTRQGEDPEQLFKRQLRPKFLELQAFLDRPLSLSMDRSPLERRAIGLLKAIAVRTCFGITAGALLGCECTHSICLQSVLEPGRWYCNGWYMSSGSCQRCCANASCYCRCNDVSTCSCRQYCCWRLPFLSAAVSYAGKVTFLGHSLLAGLVTDLFFCYLRSTGTMHSNRY